MTTTIDRSLVQQVLYENIFGTFTMNDEMELKSIFFHRLIHLPNGHRTKILKAGMEITCIDGELVDAVNLLCATHRIQAVYGTLINTNFKIQVIDLFTNEISFVKL